MALRAIDIHETRDYVSKYDKEEPKTIFRLGVLDSRIRAELEDEATSFEVSSRKGRDRAKTTMGLNRRDIEVVQFGLKGMENFLDAKGHSVKFETISLAKQGKNYMVPAPQILRILPFLVIKELAEEILQDNRLSEEEEKN